MRVMVVEDGRTTRMMLKSAVERLGHECLTAADGTEAWDLFRSQGADVIISDWLMPGIEGPELCRLVRNHPHLRLIAAERVSGLHKRLAEQDARRIGCRFMLRGRVARGPLAQAAAQSPRRAEPPSARQG